ncbi:MAG TPA: hypothetical protein VF762_10485 [Blastocatellia bacterium]|jgi:phenylacetate-CoA ligase
MHLRQTQISKLQALLLHCGERVPFYEKLIPADLVRERPLDAFFQLPLINKKSIRSNYFQFLARDLWESEGDFEVISRVLSDSSNCENESPLTLCEGRLLFFEKTSGSTGTPLKMIKSMKERMIAGKSAWKLRRGLDGSVRPANMFPFEHAPINFSFPYDTGDYSPENVRNILAEIRRRGYVWLHGHPQGLEWWAEIILDDSSMRGIAEFNYVESNGSKLFERSRALIEEAFDCRVVDNYNCREVWTVAYECKNQRLHLNTDLVLAEVMDERGEPITEPGRPGRLFITSLYSFAMPFIRYNLADQVQYAGGACDCGTQSPIIEVIAGRPSERVFGRGSLYGSDVFSKVTRYLYGSFDFQYTQVRVLQVGPERFAVYVSDFVGDRAEFKAKFHQISQALLEIEGMAIETHFVDANEQVFRDHPYALFVCKCAGRETAPSQAVGIEL